jgi:hypothetical protein
MAPNDRMQLTLAQFRHRLPKSGEAPVLPAPQWPSVNNKVWAPAQQAAPGISSSPPRSHLNPATAAERQSRQAKQLYKS